LILIDVQFGYIVFPKSGYRLCLFYTKYSFTTCRHLFIVMTTDYTLKYQTMNLLVFMTLQQCHYDHNHKCSDKCKVSGSSHKRSIIIVCGLVEPSTTSVMLPLPSTNKLSQSHPLVFLNDNSYMCIHHHCRKLRSGIKEHCISTVHFNLEISNLSETKVIKFN